MKTLTTRGIDDNLNGSEHSDRKIDIKNISYGILVSIQILFNFLLHFSLQQFKQHPPLKKLFAFYLVITYI